MNLFDGGRSGGFEFDVHWYALEELEDFFESGNFLIVGGDGLADSEIELNLIFEIGQLVKVQIANVLIDPTRPFKTVIMMHNEHIVFSLADIHFEHVSLVQELPKPLNGVFSRVARATSVTYSEDFFTLEGFGDSLVGVGFGFVEEVGEAKEKHAGGDVTACNVNWEGHFVN